MAGNVKNNKGTRRYTVLFDEAIYDKARKLAIDKRIKWYQFINMLLAKEVGMSYPKSLRHASNKKGKQ